MNNKMSINEYKDLIQLAKQSHTHVDEILLSHLIAMASDSILDYLDESDNESESEEYKIYKEEINILWEKRYKNIYCNDCARFGLPLYRDEWIEEDNLDYGSLWVLYIKEQCLNKEQYEMHCDKIEHIINNYNETFLYDASLNHIRVKLLVLEHYKKVKNDFIGSIYEVANAIEEIDIRYSEFKEWFDYVKKRYDLFMTEKN